MSLSDLNIVVWYNELNRHKCGYCKNSDGSISDGMWADSLTVADYQMLIDRGWRRSGKYCYKPVMDETCCPQYTIKCEATNFNLTKSQKKIIKKFNKYLKDGILDKKETPQAHLEAQEIAPDLTECQREYTINKNAVEINSINTMEAIQLSLGTGEPCHTNINEDLKEQSKIDMSEGHCSSGKSSLKTSHKNEPDHSRAPCKKAKLMRIERKKEKLKKLGLEFKEKEPIQKNQKSIEQFMNEDENPKIGFRITMERLTVSSENFHASAKLFEKYQILIHNEPLHECNEEQFTNFLVRSPLKPENFPDDDGPGYGSFHQQYWLDDKLVAVGVIDILPKCVSSVYFFYDPDYRNLTLGTYGSLRELLFVRSLQKKYAEIENYYMGFYIHSCPKMRYKGKLVPSYLLCPETYCWVPIEICVNLLEESSYCRLNQDIDAVDEDIPNIEDLANVKIIYKQKFISYNNFINIFQMGSKIFDKIGKLIGKKCINSLAFWLE